jgi:molecular chaperone GrpE
MATNKKKDEKLEQEINELTGLLKRVQADFENFRKRTQKEKEDFGKYLNMDLVLRILPVMDNFKLALKHLPKELESDEWVHGVWHIEKQLEQILTDEGVTEVKAEGAKFDPAIHEAIQEVESDLPEESIVEVVAPGYLMGEKLIRPAKVKVSGKDLGLRDRPGDAEC